jgi:fibronectin type 3 domain-containing protein
LISLMVLLIMAMPAAAITRPAVPLGPPRNVEASDCTYTDGVAIEWDTVSGATSYEVWRAPSPLGFKVKVCSTTIAACGDTSALPNTVYYYWVRARELLGGWTDFGGPDLGIRKSESRPPAPTNVRASDGTYAAYVRVVWDRPPGTKKFGIYKSPTPAVIYLLAAYTDTGSWQDTAALPGKTYSYRVIASDLCDQWSVRSAADRGFRPTIPPKPTNVEATFCDYADKVQLTWDAVAQATYYEVWQGFVPIVHSLFKIGTTTAATFEDTAPDIDLPLYYWVKACNVAGCSDFSGGVEGRACRFGPPRNVTASKCTYPDLVRIDWDAITYATTYKVYRAASTDGAKTQIGEPAGNAYDDTGAGLDQIYFYWVTACKGTNCSGYSGHDLGAACTYPGRVHLPLVHH